MRKIPVLFLLVLLAVFTVSAASASSWGYYTQSQNLMFLWEAVFPQCPLEPGELTAGEYRLQLNTGKFNGTYDIFYSDEEREFSAHNFFVGLDLALSKDWSLSFGYNTIPEYTVPFDDSHKNMEKTSLFNLRLSHFLAEDKKIFGGFAQYSNHFSHYYDDILHEDSEGKTNYLYLGVELKGTLFE